MYCYHCMNNKGNELVCPYCHKGHDGQVPAHHLRPGTVLNKKYLVGYVIGEGGFGITYIGRDTTLDMRVAIKEFYPSGYTNRNSFKQSTVTIGSDKQRAFFEKGKERFLIEARNVAKFSSEKGIVDVRDYFEANGTAYIIMEYLDGIDLNKYLNTYGVMPADKAFDLMLPVMRSLEKINSAGIIHRDISPDNIMYLKDGSLKLMDFGSARHFTNEEKEMSIMLKQGYAPEEQYRKNGNQGPWTDVYGMCATLYRCITGKVPEDGLDRIHVDNLKPPSQLGVKIPPALETVLMYGLAVFPENRCQNMTELIGLVTKARSAGRVIIAPVAGTVLKSHTADGEYKDRVSQGFYNPDGRNLTYGDSFSGAQRQGQTQSYYRPPQQQKPSPPPPPEKEKSSAAPVIIISLVAVLLIAGVVLLFMFGDSWFGAGSKKSGSTEAPVVETEAPTDPPTEEQPVTVPDVTGKKLTEAKEIIEEAGLAWDVDTIESDMTQNYVVKQIPEGYAEVRPGTKVTLLIPDEKPTEEPTDPPTEEPTQDPDLYYNYARYSVLLHKSPSRTSGYYLEIPNGAAVKYIERTGEFYKVRYNLFTGYVLSKFFSKSIETDFNYDEEYLRPMVCTEDATVYYNPSLNSVSFDLTEGDRITVVGYLSDEKFYEIYWHETLCYVAKSDLERFFDDTTI